MFFGSKCSGQICSSFKTFVWHGNPELHYCPKLCLYCNVMLTHTIDSSPTMSCLPKEGTHFFKEIDLVSVLRVSGEGWREVRWKQEMQTDNMCTGVMKRKIWEYGGKERHKVEHPPPVSYASETWRWNVAQESQIPKVERRYTWGKIGISRWKEESTDAVY